MEPFDPIYITIRGRRVGLILSTRPPILSSLPFRILEKLFNEAIIQFLKQF